MRMGCLPWLVCSLLAWTNAYTVEELLTDTVDMVENIAEAVPNEITNVKHKLYKHSLGASHDFMKKHNKTYATQHEYEHRYRTLRNNMKKVYEIQALEQGSTVYGATRLADLTEEEFKTNYLGFNKLADIPDITLPERNYLADIPYIPLPGSFDWRDQGAVTKAKNHCWIAGGPRIDIASTDRHRIENTDRHRVLCSTDTGVSCSTVPYIAGSYLHGGGIVQLTLTD